MRVKVDGATRLDPESKLLTATELRQDNQPREESMTDTESMKKSVRSTYVARIRGDLEGTMAAFADDVVYEFNSKGLVSP